MKTHVFTIVLDRQPSETELDGFFGQNDDDVAFGIEDGFPIAEFDREAATFAEAIVSAVRSLESIGLIPARVIDGDLLTLADIADRIGQSRESVRRYAAGSRGPRDFPPPVNPGRDGTAFYRWSEVAPWMRKRLGIEVPNADTALVVANLVLQARRHRGEVANIAALSQLLIA